jgi:hypothetical protein
MRILIAIALACACTDQEAPDHFIVGGGGGPPQSGSAVFGGIPPSVLLITGRVCVLADPRLFAVCSTTGAGGLVVRLGNSFTVTGTSGSFSMPAPTGTNLSFTVSGPSIVTSTQPLTSSNTIPVLTQDLFGQVLAANGITLTQGSGSILASIVDRGGNPVSGVTATSTPSPAFGPFFDGTTPTAFTLNGTGARGVVMFPGVTIGPAALTFNDLATSGETTVDGVQVVDGGITFVDAVLP